MRSAGPVGAGGDDRVKRVGDGDHPRGERDRISRQTVRVPGSVDPLVVVADDHAELGIAELGDEFAAPARMLLDDRELGVVELSPLVQDLARGVELANVVERGRRPHLRNLMRGQAEPAGDHLRVASDPAGMTRGVRIAGLECVGEAEQKLGAAIPSERCISVDAIEERDRVADPPLQPEPAQPPPEHELAEQQVA